MHDLNDCDVHPICSCVQWMTFPIQNCATDLQCCYHARTFRSSGLRCVDAHCRYVQQGLRAVNQAMGRVIRHRWDYGAVLLADERFGSQQNLRNMSRWLRDQVVHHNNFGSSIASLTKFFKVIDRFMYAAGQSRQASRQVVVLA